MEENCLIIYEANEMIRESTLFNKMKICKYT